MKKVYQALVPLGLGAAGIGAMTRAFTGARDGSLAFGDIQQNLKLLAANDPYLSSVSDSIVLPCKQKKEKEKEASTMIDFSNLSSPLTTFFRGSSRPTGNERATDIPAWAPLAAITATAGVLSGSRLMDKRLKNVASNKLKKEKDRVRQEFEAALIYEQEEAAKRNKKASEQCDLVQAVDEFYSAAARFENLDKIAGIETAGISLIGLLSLLSGAYGAHKQYKKTKGSIQQSEKEKLLGLNTDYDTIMRNMGAKNIGQNVTSISKQSSCKKKG